MSDPKESIDYKKMVKDHVHIRLAECGWHNRLNKLLQNAIVKRVQAGQKAEVIKLEQLYQDVFDQALEAIPGEVKSEFHEKIRKYLSTPEIYIQPVSSSLSHEGPSVNSSKVSSNMIPSVSSNVPSDIPSDDFSNDGHSWFDPQNSYYVDL